VSIGFSPTRALKWRSGGERGHAVTAMTNQDFIRTLGRHFVNLCWIDETPGTIYGEANNGEGTPFTTSGFIISILGNWFLITAGHILSGIETARMPGRNKPAQVLTNFMIDDTWGINSKFPQMPFDFDAAWKRYVDDEEQGHDYGAIQVVGNIRDRLEANGVEALAECSWKDIPDEFEQYFLLGTPRTLEKVDTDGGLYTQRTLVRFEVEGLNTRPAEMTPTICPLIYYRIPATLSERESGELLGDIDGMSGGPLYGVHRDEAGKRRIYLLGIQSGWRKDLKVAYACPLNVLGNTLEAVIERSFAAQQA